MLAEFALINKFLYYSLALISTGGAISYVQKIKNKPDKLTNTELKGYKALKSITGNDGLKISKNVRLKEKYDYEGVCMIAPTGAGKTTSLFLNNLLENIIRGSFIVTDPKGEMFELTSGYQKNVCGRKVYKIDFRNTDYSEKYNLLDGCNNSEEVIQLASDLLMNGALSVELTTGKKVGGMEWIQMSEPLLAATLLYAKGLERPFNTIEFALQLILTLKNWQIKALIEKSNNIDAITQYNIFEMVGGSEKTEASIKITLASNMKLFVTKDVNKIGIDTTLDIENFRKEESILYIIYPERKSSYLAPFIAPLFSQIINKLLDSYKKNESLPIHLLFDEFGNLGMLSNMKVNVATVRSRLVNMTVCLQSISQLQQIYGLDTSKTILNNLKTKIVLAGISDIDTLNYISNICGTQEINTKNISYSGEKQSQSYSKSKKKIFEDGELRTIEADTGLLVIGNKMPVIDEMEYYFNTDKKENVIGEVEYKKYKMPTYDIRKELNQTSLQLKEDLKADLKKEVNNKSTDKAIEDIFMCNE